MTPRYSWPAFREPLELLLTTPELDGEAIAADALDPLGRRLSLDSEDWKVMTAEISLGLGGQSVPAGVEAARQTMEAVAVLTSEAGYVRIPVPLARQGDEDRFVGRLSAARDEVGGVGRLEAEIVAEMGGVGHRVIGTAQTWTLVFDAISGPPASGKSPIQTVWVDFSESPAGLVVDLSAYPETPLHLDVSGPEPVLYLNSSLKAFQTVLSLEHASGARKTVRDLMGAWLATTVTLALARAGLRSLGEDDDGTLMLPDDPVVNQALEALVGEMQSVETVEQIAERLGQARDDPAVEARLWAEVFLSAHRLTTAGTVLEEAAQRVLYE